MEVAQPSQFPCTVYLAICNSLVMMAWFNMQLTACAHMHIKAPLNHWPILVKHRFLLKSPYDSS